VRTRNHKKFATAVRRVLTSRDGALSAARGATSDADPRRRRGPSTTAMRRELESFRQAQAIPYWHHDRRAG
jgi:hypothetical protein